MTHDRIETMPSPADFNAQIIEEFRANHGRVGGIFAATPLLLLHHTGARSGRQRIAPLGFVTDGERYVVCASNGGAPANPDWYHNLKTQPETMIEVRTELIPVRASEPKGNERDRLWQASVQNAPQLDEYAQKAGRTIPVIVLTPGEHR